MSDFVLDASVALQWLLEDEGDRKYSLAVLASLSLTRLKALPIEAAQQASFEILELPALATFRHKIEPKSSRLTQILV